MAYALSQGWEGLVLKARRDSYMNINGLVAKLVKLKKDYISGLGDSVQLGKLYIAYILLNLRHLHIHSHFNDVNVFVTWWLCEGEKEIRESNT